MFEVNFIGILTAAIVAFLLGFLWYAPRVFGRAWMRLANISPETVEKGKRKMPFLALIAFVATVVMAYVLNHFAIAWGVVDIMGAIEIAFWAWLGFVAPVMLGVVLWEGKSWKLYAINAGYWLTALIVMAVVLFVMAS